MSFGWSVGDIVSCIAVIVRVSKGLKDSTGATAEYEAAADFLNGLKTTLEKLKEHLDSYPDTFHAKDIGEQAERLKAAVEKFKVKAEKFEASLASDSTRSSIRRAPRKIQWTLFADSIKELQRAISQPQNVLNTTLLLQTLKAAEQASQTSALSQQELAKIALSVMDILPAQLASTANDLKAALNEGIGYVVEKQQEEMSERQQEVQQLRELIEQHGKQYVVLETSLKIQQQLVLDTLESCVQARLDDLFEGLHFNDTSANEPVDAGGAKSEEGFQNSDNDANLFVGMAAGLHMLGYLMSGLLGPVFRTPSSSWPGSDNDRFISPPGTRNNVDASIDNFFQGLFRYSLYRCKVPRCVR
ncbi:hypothetical protein L207DRAFT_146641 [Hyaloscypha variabilis F]|uniref:Fungal N-terminal domain-containing protein n=1 Tax=Hyaloscypha variabilis (strain UAMH 11265 / GT02V1 / F) TaxID=1149755 RepID=A0A2J6R5R5_HYAVF|nr:hypothetical protein L207DRAFT_146641 [Hyaloscypha variabilis F]